MTITHTSTSVPKQDLRIIKTHQTIRQAFVALLLQYEYEHITVQHILDKALVNRNTFYKYYAGKSDLAGQMIADFTQQHQQLIDKRLQGEHSLFLLNQSRDFFYQHRHMILALWKIKTKRHHLYEDMFAVIKQVFIKLAQQNYPQQQDWDYQAHCFATLVMTTAQYHFERDLPIPIHSLWQKLAQIIEIVHKQPI